MTENPKKKAYKELVKKGKMSAADLILLQLYYDKHITYKKYYARDNFVNVFLCA